MSSSPGFESSPCNSCALFGLAFAPPPDNSLSLLHRSKSPAHASIGTPPPAYGAVIACKSTVSGSLSLPFRGSFHRSLTVLFAIGHWEYLALRGGPRGFSHRFTNNDLLRCSMCHPAVRLRDCHRLWWSFPGPSAGRDESRVGVLQPQDASILVWADPGSLAATDGIDVSFCSFRY